MKTYLKLLLAILPILWTSKVFNQCVKDISTNPNNPVNEEYIDFMSAWYPDDTITVNSFLNSGFNWYLPNNI